MTEETHRAFVMTTIDLRPVAEVAAALGLTEAKVHSAKHRVLQRIKKILADVKDD